MSTYSGILVTTSFEARTPLSYSIPITSSVPTIWAIKASVSLRLCAMTVKVHVFHPSYVNSRFPWDMQNPSLAHTSQSLTGIRMPSMCTTNA